ncbi:hypothetical protein B9Z55_023621 [Caenorhabditis nigoni]|uniref:Uncharacterized protein n=1 Tax=Caenorhabditis nigoni TaxID=1611254 RepID=A0A2G5SQJ7_9PELO|nr:hypothetical protein B9Z55_023621 [Caenorhabditis nigoni]
MIGNLTEEIQTPELVEMAANKLKATIFPIFMAYCILIFSGEMQETDVLFKSKKNSDVTPPKTKNETPQIPHEPSSTKLEEEPSQSSSEGEATVAEEVASSSEEAKPTVAAESA